VLKRLHSLSLGLATRVVTGTGEYLANCINTCNLEIYTGSEIGCAYRDTIGFWRLADPLSKESHQNIYNDPNLR